MFLKCNSCGQQLTADHIPTGAQEAQCPNCGATVPIFDQNTFVSQPQESSPPPPPPATGSPAQFQIEGYEILDCLGEGGMGIVYLARQVSLDRKVAIKVMSPALLKDPSFIVRFDREIAALVRLSHPHIVTIFDRGHSPDGLVYYIMEYVEGFEGGSPIDLERLIIDQRLNSQKVRILMLQIVQALGFAHREGIIHRDVKPSNILIDRHGYVKVADFGIASMKIDRGTRHVTMANQAVGTAAYMAPEQQQDAASADHRSDIYAAGIMLYQMLTGKLPAAGYEPPSQVVAGLSPQWDAIIAKALQQRPENRFPDMKAFEMALRGMGKVAGGQTAPGAAPQKAPQKGPSPMVAPGAPTSPGKTVAQSPTPAGQKNAAAGRADVIKRAEQLFLQGQWKQAAELMAKAAELFGGDQEIANLMLQYRARVNQLDEMLGRMSALARQNRWCEVSQILAELQQSGVVVQGIEQYTATARQKLDAIQPLLTEANGMLRQKRTAEATEHAHRALEQVTDHGEALGIIDAARRLSVGRRRRRVILVGLFTLIGLGVIGSGMFLYYSEKAAIVKARGQIDNGEYEEASQTIEDMSHRWFVDRDASYLQSVADLETYASAYEVGSDELLKSSTEKLKDMFDADESWLAQGKMDLAKVLAHVPLPPDAEDTLPRTLEIARKLNELQVVERTDLAKGLLENAKGRPEFRSPPTKKTYTGPANYVKQILEWDPTKGRAVVALALPEDELSREGVRAIRSWAEKTPSLAGTLAASVAQIADQYVVAGKYQDAKMFVDGARKIDTGFNKWEYWKKHFNKVNGESAKDAMTFLTYMVKGEENIDRLKDATGLYKAFKIQYPKVTMVPPHEIEELVNETYFHEKIADAEVSYKDEKYQDARIKLDSVSRQFPTLWKQDRKAIELDRDVTFHLHIEKARKAYDNADFATALAETNAALQVRPKDKGTLELQNKARIAADKVEFEKNRQEAERFITQDDFSRAVDEVLKARRILENPANAEWIAPKRAILDKLTGLLVIKIRDRAARASEKRHYEEAKAGVKLGQKLMPKDEKLSDLFDKVEALMNDPETANLSGTWICKEGNITYKMVIKDTSPDAASWVSYDSEGKELDSGLITRKGTELRGTSPCIMDGFSGEMKVKARLETPNTMSMYSRVFKPTNTKVRRLPGWTDLRSHTWAKEASKPAGTPDKTKNLLHGSDPFH